MQIIDIIANYGPVTRETLVSMSGMTDRKVRRRIEMLKKSGASIINNGRGYILINPEDPASLSELKRYYMRQRSAAISALASLSKIRKVLKEHGEI